MTRPKILKRSSHSSSRRDDQSPFQTNMSTRVSMRKYNKLKQELKHAMELNKALTKIVLQSGKNSNKRRAIYANHHSFSQTQNLEAENEEEETSSTDNSSDIEKEEEPVLVRPNLSTLLSRRSKQSSVTNRQQQQQQAANEDQSTPSALHEAPWQVESIHTPSQYRETAQPPSRIAVPPRMSPISRDENGEATMPQSFGKIIKTKVISLGQIKATPNTFHTTRYIYPVGYTIERLGDSMIYNNKKSLYTMKILDAGNHPLFQVGAADQPHKKVVASGKSPTTVWREITVQSNAIRQVPPPAHGFDGHSHFGFKITAIAKLIQELPGVENLENYRMKQFTEEGGVPRLAEVGDVDQKSQKITTNDDKEVRRNSVSKGKFASYKSIGKKRARRSSEDSNSSSGGEEEEMIQDDDDDSDDYRLPSNMSSRCSKTYALRNGRS